MKRLLLHLCAPLGVAAPQAASAQPSLFDSPALSDAELADARGGFMLPSGGQIDFGAMVTTSIDGIRLLQTQLRISTQGIAAAVSAAPNVTVTIDGMPANTVTSNADIPPNGGDTPSSNGGGGLSITLSGTEAGTAPDPNTASTASGYLRASVELPDVAVYHTIGRQISSIIVNTGDNRIVDNQIAVNLRLDNVQPLTLGSIGFQIEALSLDAATLRAP